MNVPNSVEECRNRTIHRIHRIQGQLASLERSVTEDKDCEVLVVQARTVQRAMASLINYMCHGYFNNQAKEMMQTDADLAIEKIERIFDLASR